MSSPFTPAYGQYITEAGFGEGAFDEDGYDVSTIIRLATPRPAWTAVNAASSPAFGPFPLTGAVLEVGFGEGGFGEDGYDTKSILYTLKPQAGWTKVTTK